MTSQNEKICLVMIVKNESQIITKCLESIYPFLSSWSISDTGSTDGTQDIIKNFFEEKKIPGKLWEDEWKNFGYNRTLAFDHAQEVAKEGYFIVLDADSTFCGQLTIPLGTKSDGINIPIIYGNIFHKRVALFRAGLRWCYRGVVHEYPDCRDPFVCNETLQTGHIIDSTDGSRGQDPQKYEKDAALLLKSMEDNPNTRDCFYLAQSYRDAGQPQEAIKWYKFRTMMDGWVEEKYISCLNIARLSQDNKDKITYFRKAWNYSHRLEALTDLMRVYRDMNDFQNGFKEGLPGIFVEKKDHFLFNENDVYDFRYLDELSIAAYYTGNWAFGKLLFDKMKNIPENQIQRIHGNRDLPLILLQ